MLNVSRGRTEELEEPFPSPEEETVLAVSGEKMGLSSEIFIRSTPAASSSDAPLLSSSCISKGTCFAQ